MSILLPLGPPGPTWTIINADQPASLPLVGQFDPKIQEQKGKPIWQTKAGIGGGLPWLKHVGVNLGFFTFEFNAIASTVIDQYPLLAWERLNELAAVDSTLGRPPRVRFNHGVFYAEGFITDIPEAPIMHWEGNIVNSRIIRQIGPIRITITRVPKPPTELSLGTNYVTRTVETKFEELALQQYGDARYAQTLDAFNQGVRVEEQITLPRKNNDRLSTTTPVSVFYDDE